MVEFGIDDQLLTGFREGDHQCFAIIFDRHYRNLCSFAADQTHCATDAEDIVQASFIKLWEYCGMFDSDASIKAFLYNTTYTACVKFRNDQQALKQHRRTYAKQLMQTLGTRHATSDLTLLTKVFAAVQSLPPLCRDVVNLVYVKGMDEQEAASVLHISASAVRNERIRALYLLKKLFVRDSILNRSGFRLTILAFINAEPLARLTEDSFVAHTEWIYQNAHNLLNVRRGQLLQNALRFCQPVAAVVSSVVISIAVLKYDRQEVPDKALLYEVKRDHPKEEIVNSSLPDDAILSAISTSSDTFVAKPKIELLKQDQKLKNTLQTKPVTGIKNDEVSFDRRIIVKLIPVLIPVSPDQYQGPDPTASLINEGQFTISKSVSPFGGAVDSINLRTGFGFTDKDTLPPTFKHVPATNEKKRYSIPFGWKLCPPDCGPP